MTGLLDISSYVWFVLVDSCGTNYGIPVQPFFLPFFFLLGGILTLSSTLAIALLACYLALRFAFGLGLGPVSIGRVDIYRRAYLISVTALHSGIQFSLVSRKINTAYDNTDRSVLFPCHVLPIPL